MVHSGQRTATRKVAGGDCSLGSNTGKEFAGVPAALCLGIDGLYCLKSSKHSQASAASQRLDSRVEVNPK